ncbi:MAG: HD domain-containing phosphohydrolase [Vicinamibacterales bacterium]
MRVFRTLPKTMQVYVTCVGLCGFAIIVQSVTDVVTGQKQWTWMILVLLTLVSGSATVRLPSLPATISVSETFVFTSVLLFGPATGTLTVALDAFVISFWSYKKDQPLYKVIFNVCALPLTIWIAAHLFFLTAGIPPLTISKNAVPIRELLLPLLVFTIAYFSLNSWIITFAISLEKQLPPLKIWRENFVWLSLNYFGGASVAALLVTYSKDLDLTFLAVIVPLLVVLYFTFSMSMGRVEDANRHLSQLNTLYMSTIETLAMAIDAKDQITHGHIRRVQTYAIALAKSMGVSDEKLIRAIEAAALLHDMGKLAVPEYILNKPGPLTPTEFEKMKLHASVGADILSAIEFPYPVVPIVRHHHENWDGTGYPDGLAGASIPIGARILSVVDCFDALTSDRPYRPRLPDRDALKILWDRRGTMYDPLVIDTFTNVYASIIPPELATPKSLLAITDASIASYSGDATHHLDDITASSGEALTLFRLAQALATSRGGIRDAANLTFESLRRLVPHYAGVLFAYRSQSDDLCAVAASGELEPLVVGLRLQLGHRLSGWVAANRRTIRNSDAVLDLGEITKATSTRLRSCLSAPVIHNGQLAGVITVYSATTEAFSEDHERVIEALGTQIATQLFNSEALTSTGLVRAVTPSLGHGSSTLAIERPETTICVAVLKVHRRSSLLPPLEVIADLARERLQASDLVFRRAEELILLLHVVDRDAAEALVANAILHVRARLNDAVALSSAIVCEPNDIADLEQVFASDDPIAPAKPPSSIH